MLLLYELTILRRGKQGNSLRFFAQFPDIFHRPVSGPLCFLAGSVRTGCFCWRLHFNQVFNREAILTEEPYPFAIGQLELHRVLPLEAVHTEVIIEQSLLNLVCLDVLTEHEDGCCSCESKESTWA